LFLSWEQLFIQFLFLSITSIFLLLFFLQVGSSFLGAYDFTSHPFDWGGSSYSRPAIPPQDLIVLELPVRCFTADASSGIAPTRRGTFAGLADKIPHLLELGINAVELLPVFEYDELEFQRKPNPRDHMTNVWGYSHLSFFSPMSRFGQGGGSGSNGGVGSDPVATAEEFKDMVRKLHGAGIEVIIDVVYNHTAEGEITPLVWRLSLFLSLYVYACWYIVHAFKSALALFFLSFRV